jgi:hypothetical protein
VSIRALPENSLIYRENPDIGRRRDYGGARGSIFKDGAMIRERRAVLSPEGIHPDERYLGLEL